jgi:ParB family transcriptional regulator, chromosome partitioning protein
MNIQHFPLDQLELSPLNPRKEEPRPEEIEALAESIATVGLQQNLIGFINDDNSRPVVEIVGGGRRLRAIKLLHERGALQIEGDEHGCVSVPVQLHDTPDAAVSAAIAENEARKDMGPVDKFHAYHAQVSAGATEQDCARRYGVSVNEVRRILALGVLNADIFDALRLGHMDLDTARAFTVTTDTDAQAEVFARWQSNPSWMRPRDIRHALRKDSISSERTQRLRIVGERAYEMAGGRITRDLFSEEVYIEDPEVLDRVWQSFIGSLEDKAKAEGWQWLAERPGYGGMPQDSERCYPQQVEIPEGDAQRYDELAELHEAGALDLDQTKEFEALMERLDHEEWTEDQRSVAGVYVSTTYDGELRFERGVILKKDVGRAIELGVLCDNSKPSADAENAVDTNRLNEFAGSLMEDMRALRVATAQQQVALKPAKALALLAWHISEHDYLGPLSMGMSEPLRGDGEAIGGPKPVAVERPGREPVPFAEWSENVGSQQVKGIITEWVASLLRNRSEETFAQVERAFGSHPRLLWKPDEKFFGRMKADQLGLLWTQLTGTKPYGDTKRDRVREMAELFANPAAMLERIHAPEPDEAMLRIETWVPSPIRRAEAPAEVQDEAA